MAEVLEQIDQFVNEAEAELAQVKDLAGLEQFRIKYLGSNGKVKTIMEGIKSVPPDQKKAYGQKANGAKSQLQTGHDTKKADLSAATGPAMTEDVTEPGKRPLVGNRHILMKVVDELTALFGRMGFEVAAGPEVEDEFHNFIALNIPENHPARDPLDNFYLETKAGDPSLLLRTQTSTVQIRVMETQKPPIRVVIPGKVYRPDTVDATHLFMFHQLEALVIDKNVTMVDLKSTIMQFVKAYFGPETKVRFRPSFFPFTEPSAEVDMSCVFCKGAGCGTCSQTGWMEILGCGMIHPQVLRNVGIDPEEWSGFAFGLGLDRCAMIKFDIPNIRTLFENDLRVLQQF